MKHEKSLPWLAPPQNRRDRAWAWPPRATRGSVFCSVAEQTFPWGGDLKFSRRKDVSCEKPVSQCQGQNDTGRVPRPRPCQSVHEVGEFLHGLCFSDARS